MIKPVNNNVLVEIEDKSKGRFVTSGEQEGYESGILRAVPTSGHMMYVASNAWALPDKNPTDILSVLNAWIGKKIYWEEYAERGNTFEENGIKYALVNFTKLTGVEL